MRGFLQYLQHVTLGLLVFFDSLNCQSWAHRDELLVIFCTLRTDQFPIAYMKILKVELHVCSLITRYEFKLYYC